MTTQNYEVFRVTPWSYDFTWSILCDTIRHFRYECQSGFVITGEPIVQCLQNGSLSQIPSCQRLPAKPRYHCTTPPPVPNASGFYRWIDSKLVYVPFSEEQDKALNSTVLFELYETVSYVCQEPHFKIWGSSITECQFNRKWTTLPICWPSQSLSQY